MHIVLFVRASAGSSCALVLEQRVCCFYKAEISLKCLCTDFTEVLLQASNKNRELILSTSCCNAVTL